MSGTTPALLSEYSDICTLDNNISATASIKSILDKKLYLQKIANNSVTTLNIFNNHEYLRGNIYQ